MSSKRRIADWQPNGTRSQGPRTAAGKSRSPDYALRHDLLAKHVVLSNESQPNFEIVFSQHVDKFDPQDGVEYGRVEEMVASYWSLHRALAIEKSLFDAGAGQCTRPANPAALPGHTPPAAPARHEQPLALPLDSPEKPEMRNEPIPNSGHSEPNPVAPHGAMDDQTRLQAP